VWLAPGVLDGDVEDLPYSGGVEHKQVLRRIVAVAFDTALRAGVGAAGDVTDDDHVVLAGHADGADADAQVENVPQLDQCGLGVGALVRGDAGMGADRTSRAARRWTRFAPVTRSSARVVAAIAAHATISGRSASVTVSSGSRSHR
jgi:hypothetical protein